MQVMRIAGAQIHNAVGDLDANVRQLTDVMKWAENQGADVLVTPELALTGYPPADLVRHKGFVDEAEDALQQLARQSDRTTSIISTIDRVPPQRSWDTRDRDVTIAAKLLCDGEVRGTYHKCLLPTYGIYDEGKNFAPGRHPDAVWGIGDVVAGVSICEDIWSNDGPPEAQSAAGAQVLLVPNASPYYRGKTHNRFRLARVIARRNGVPLIYINFFGGHDDIVFDGGSLVIDQDGQLLHRCAEFAADRFCIDVPLAAPRPVTGPLTRIHTRPLPDRQVLGREAPDELADELTGVWQALVVATRDFTRKNRFPGAVLGLSGGIDSAVTAAVAAEALGPKQVLGLAMPPEDGAEEETHDAEALADKLGIDFSVIPMSGVEHAVTNALKPRLGPLTGPETRRDLEAWSRAAILSAFADEQGLLILATGNKSELAIGVAPHGDLVGDFAPLRDCPKTLVYDLARRCNRGGEVIPERVLTRQPTAQAAGKGDGLPPYDVLDAIVERYLEKEAGLEDLVADGFDPEVVEWVLRRIDDAEFLRRQTPIGVRVTAIAFDQDRRMPISNAWRPHRRKQRPVDARRAGDR